MKLGYVAVPFGVVFLGIFGLIAFNIFGGVYLAASGTNQTHAEEQLRAYVAGTQYTARSCRNRDTDANGYISCEALDKEGEITQLECAAPFTLNNGCRVPKLVTNGFGRN